MSRCTSRPPSSAFTFLSWPAARSSGCSPPWAAWLIPPEVEPRASEHLDDIVAMVASLLATGAAYELDGDIYFDVSATPDYGRISGYSTSLMTKFAQVRGGDPERAGKRSRWTSCCGAGSPTRAATRRAGRRRWDRGAPAGTSNAPSWPTSTSERGSTSTAAART